MPLQFKDSVESALVSRICAAPQLAKSVRLQEFLRFVTERAFTGRADEINEQVIGHEVFGRRADYSPNEDNIVRVEARQLRKKLAEYFANEGREEPLVLSIPKGAYVPLFSPREAEPVNRDAEEPATHTGLGNADSPRVRTQRLIPVATTALLLLAALLAASTGYFWLEARRAEMALDLANAPLLRHALWSQLFEQNRATVIVAADSNLVLIRNLSPLAITLDDYVARRLLPPRASVSAERYEALKTIQERQYTSLADVSVASRILQANRLEPTRALLRFARNMEIRDFKSNNVILMGSSLSNPWVELFEPSMSFITRYDPRNKVAYFENRRPQQGEVAEYKTLDAATNRREGFAVIALLPNLNSDGRVLLIQGTSSEGTEAAGEFLASPNLFAQLVKRLGQEGASDLPYFEVLLRYEAFGGSSSNTSIAAHRLLTP